MLGICDTVQVDSYNQLLEELNQLNIPITDENSLHLKAIMCAAKASRENSPIFVFTDDSLPDQELLGEVEAIIAKKNLEINIIRDSLQVSKLSFDKRQIHKRKRYHYKRQMAMTDIYEELADFSDGQNIQIPVDEISEIGPAIIYSATQSSNTIYHYSNIAFGSTNIFFMVNSYASNISIFVSGQDFNVSVYTPQGKYLL